MNIACDWQAIVTSTPRRRPTLKTTLRSIRNAGWQDIMIACEPGVPPQNVKWCLTWWHWNADKLGAWPNWLHALKQARNRNPQWILICQDDILIAKHARQWIESELSQFLQPSILSLYTPANQVGASQGWHEQRYIPFKPNSLAANSYGALCYVMSRSVADLVLSNPPGGGSLTRVDYWVGVACEQNKIHFWRHTPSLVQHTGKTSTVHSDRIMNKSRLAETRVASCWIRDLSTHIQEQGCARNQPAA